MAGVTPDLPGGLVVGVGDLADPHVSPLSGTFSAFPPTYLLAGTRELFPSNAVLMHGHLLDAGVTTELHVVEAMHHFGFGLDSPEEQRVLERLAQIERRILNQ